MINYKNIEEKFKNYVVSCGNQIESNCLNENNYGSLSLHQREDLIAKKAEMIKQKYEHTMRVVKNVTKLSRRMNQHVNFTEIARVIGLLHDIGRFEQAIFSDTYNDSISFKDSKFINNHAEAGFFILRDYGFNMLSIPQIYRPTISKNVLFHQANILPKELSQNVGEKVGLCNPDNVLSGNYYFNEFELKIISLLLQMLRDIDKIDILYQRASGETVAVKPFMLVKNIGLKETAKLWGLSEYSIIGVNSKETIENPEDRLNIPISLIPIEKLEIADDIKKRMFNHESISLSELQNRDDYSFITAIWWSVYTFLTEINFVSNLETIKEEGLLDSIYNQYGEQYKPLLDEIFNYAKEVLINEVIDNNKGNIYIRKK